MKQTVTPRQAQEGALLLVNDSHPLRAWPEARQLAPVGVWDGAPVLLRRPAAAMFTALLDAVDARGRIAAVSGWRAHAEQQALYEASVRENGPAFTQKYVALPGCSEHETGLAIDVGEARAQMDFIRPAFPDTGVCAAFRRAAADYGFIERYPERAQSITHIGGEPWHFRYVGVPHAGEIARRGCTLEEYIALLQGTAPRQPLRIAQQGRCYLVFRVPLPEDGAAFEVPERCAWQVSADQCGGLIVTAWRLP